MDLTVFQVKDERKRGVRRGARAEREPRDAGFF